MEFSNEREEFYLTNTGRYDLPVACRIPGTVKMELIAEAAKVGITFAAYLSSCIVSRHVKEGAGESRVNSLVKENKDLQYRVHCLQTEMASQKKEMEWYQKDVKAGVDVLVKNYSILQTLYHKYGEKEIEKQAFISEGFNFSYVTSQAIKDEVKWAIIFDLWYTNKQGKYYLFKSKP